MLFSIDSNEKIIDIPHKRNFDRWMERLSSADYTRISAELKSRIHGAEIHTSSWIPGEDWTGTVYEPIYRACGEDPIASAKFFGLLLWKEMLDDESYWAFGRYEKDGIPIEGLTYFRIHRDN